MPVSVCTYVVNQHALHFFGGGGGEHWYYKLTYNTVAWRFIRWS